MTPLLTADSIGKSFGNRTVLTAATLRANAGAITLLIGRSGTGKSTLLKIAAGAMQPEFGTVTFKGRPYLRASWPVLATRGLYYLADRATLSPSLTIRQHLEIVVRTFGAGAVAESAAVCDIAAHLDKRPFELSTGELRRAELATAIARGPDCLLVDEPLRNIAPLDRERIASALRHLATNGCAVVVTGHEVPELLALATCVVWCTDGTTYELGTPQEARTHWRFGREYLGVTPMMEHSAP